MTTSTGAHANDLYDILQNLKLDDEIIDYAMSMWKDNDLSIAERIDAISDFLLDTDDSLDVAALQCVLNSQAATTTASTDPILEEAVFSNLSRFLSNDLLISDDKTPLPRTREDRKAREALLSQYGYVIDEEYFETDTGEIQTRSTSNGTPGDAADPLPEIGNQNVKMAAETERLRREQLKKDHEKQQERIKKLREQQQQLKEKERRRVQKQERKR